MIEVSLDKVQEIANQYGYEEDYAFCVVKSYIPAERMRVYGWGFGDAHPPQLVEIEFEIYDSEGNHSEILEKALENSSFLDDIECQLIKKLES